MYNMEISLFGYKFNLAILILIGILYIILVGHTFCGCCNYNLMEGFDVSGNTSNTSNTNPLKANAKETPNKKLKLPTQITSDGTDSEDTSDTLDTPEASTSKEGFTGANINDGESSLYDLTNNTPMDTSHWNSPNLTIVPGQPLNSDVKAFMARGQNQPPLDPNEMDFFANTEFAPEYCPGTYSNSKGCAGMSMGQINYLQNRGGNNVPYSEY
jgi:hypothetical protein